jgi:hypothetical protein
MHKLEALRRLKDSFAAVAVRRCEALARGDDEGQADRDAAIRTLAAVKLFLELIEFSQIETKPLLRLFNALVQLEKTGKHAAMLKKPSRGGRPRDPYEVLRTKAQLAAAMGSLRKVRVGRDEAARWITKKIPSTLAAKLSNKPIEPSMVKEWYDRFGGDGGEQGIARNSYLETIEVLELAVTNGFKLKDRIAFLINRLDALLPDQANRENPPV